MTKTIPLFPLNTVLFPGGVLPLRIFEPRYLDMVSECLRTDSGIGVVLIKEGREIGHAATTEDMGTLTSISYFNKRNDGLLGVTLRGEQRFVIKDQEVLPNQSIRAEVELIPNCDYCELESKYRRMTNLLNKIISELEPPYTTMPTHYDDADWVSARLIEFMPITLSFKQELLAIDDPRLRLAHLNDFVRESKVC